MFSIIILSHNRLKLLEKSILSIVNQSLNFKNYEIIIVDSSANINDFKKLFFEIKHKFKNVNLNYFISSKNFDQTQKRNIAVRSAKFEWLLFLDDDAFLIKNSLHKVSSFLNINKKKFYILSGRLLPLLESRKYKKKLLEKKTYLNKVGYYIKDFSIIDFGLKNLIINKDYMFASLFMIKKNIYIKSGGLGPDGYKGDKILLNGSGENNILSYAKKTGLSVLYFSELCAKHYIGNYRFTKEYIRSRNFYYGVCDSFIYTRDNNYYMLVLYFIKKIILLLLIRFKIKESNVAILANLKGKIYQSFVSISNSKFRNYCKQKNWYNSKYKNFVKRFSIKTNYNYLSWTSNDK